MCDRYAFSGIAFTAAKVRRDTRNWGLAAPQLSKANDCAAGLRVSRASSELAVNWWYSLARLTPILPPLLSTHATTDTSQGIDFTYCLTPDTGLPLPDTTLFLTLSPEVASKRGAYGEERYETLDTQTRVREQFALVGREMAARHPGRWEEVSAEGTMDAVEAKVWTRVQAVVKRVEAGGEGSELGRLWV